MPLIQARLADIEDATADYQKLLAAVNFELKEAAPAAAGATTAVAATAAATLTAAAAAQPAKPFGISKCPAQTYFQRGHASAGRSEPLDLRRWFQGVARVCKGHHASPRGRLADSGSPPPALGCSITKTAWVYRYIETASSDTT
jgi:hypothetical protein